MRPRSPEVFIKAGKRIRHGAQRAVLKRVVQTAQVEQKMRMRSESALTEAGIFRPMARCMIIEGLAISLGLSPEKIDHAVREGQSRALS